MKHRDKQQCFLIIVSLAVGIVLGCCLSYRVLVAVGSPQPFPATPQSQHDAHIAPPLPVEPFFDIQAVPILPTEVRAVASAETHLDLENGLNPGPAPSALELRAIGVERGLVGALKSCLGSKCIDERPKGAARDRVLVTALPGSGGEVLYRLLVALTTNNKNAPELSFSARALPYGYGRTLGFNRVIKLVARPLWNVAAILDDAHLLDSPQAASVAADVGVQYLRWHCRQKVGHTKSLVMFTDELLGRRPLFELERAASFAGLKPDRRSLLAALAQEGLGFHGGRSTSSGNGKRSKNSDNSGRNGQHAGDGASSGQAEHVSLESPWPTKAGLLLPDHGGHDESAPNPRGLDWVTSFPNLLATTPWPPEVGFGHSTTDSAGSSSSRVGSLNSGSPGSEPSAAWLTAAVDAMESELLRSDGLQKWPCGSVAGGENSPLRMGLVPNCSLPHVSCFVSHDTNTGEHV